MTPEEREAKYGAHGGQVMVARIPENIKAGIDRFAELRVMPGSFVRAVLENNLLDAVCNADPQSLAWLKEIVQYVHWEVPGAAHGTPEKVKAWVAEGVKVR